jgi:hypothetical protein
MPHSLIARSIYNKWVDAMICPKNDVQKVLELYHEHAILLPTFSPAICTNHNQLHSYFKNLISLPTLTITTEEFLAIESEAALVASGLYTFQYTSGEKLVTIPARFTFVYKKFNGEWLIVNHHSSVLPVQATSF